MLRFLVVIAVAVALTAVVAPSVREVLAWALAFVSALLLGDLLRSSVAKLVHRTGDSTPRRT
jgi:hydrogenase/urease accessory protein HupE